MARRVRDATIENRAARNKLKVRAKPHWRSVGVKGAHVGYRKLGKGRAGTWTARLYLGKGRYVVERIADADDLVDSNGSTVLTFHEAVEQVRQRMGQRAANGTTGPLTVRAAIDLYEQKLEHAGRDAAAEAVRGRAKNHILPVLGDMLVSSLTPELLRGWLATVAKGRKPDGSKDPEITRARRASANRCWAALRAALNHAYREGKVTSDAAWVRVEPFKSVEKARAQYLTVAEAQRLVNAADADLRQLIEAALTTGCRYSELARLTVADFNPDNGSVHIRQSKGGKVRDVILNDEGIALFTELTAGKPGDDLILRKANGAAWLKSNQTVPFAEAVERAKTPPISIHGLRHTWASLAVMAGMPLMVVAKNLGHRDTAMVEKFYGHLAPSYITDAVRRSAPVFGLKRDRKITPLRGKAS